MTHKPGFVRKDYAKGFSSVFSTGVADPDCVGRYRPVTIVSPLFFKDKLPVKELRERFVERVLLGGWHRFRSIARTQSYLRMAFEEIPIEDVDMEYHTAVIQSNNKWTQDDLNSFLSSRYAHQKDYSKPLWFMHIVECMEGFGTVLIFDVDHCLADGLSMIELLCSLLDVNPLQSVDGSTGGVLKRSGKKARPSLWTKLSAFMSGSALAVLGPILPADSPNALKMKDIFNPSTTRSFAGAHKIDLERVKEIKNKMPGTTVNDVMMAVLNLAVQRYLEAKKDPAVHSDEGIRASFPVNLRKPGQKETGNAIATSMIHFGFRGYSKRQELVWRIKEQVDMIKLSPQPIVEMYLLRVLARILPKPLLLDFAIFLFGKFTLMLSNVPAPQEAAFVFGHEMVDIYYYLFVPIGVYCGMMTYNGQLSFTVASDPLVEEKPELLTKHWNTEFEALYAEAMADPMTKPPPRKSRIGPVTIATGVVAVAAAWYYLRS